MTLPLGIADDLSRVERRPGPALRTLEGNHKPGGTSNGAPAIRHAYRRHDGGKAAETITFGLDDAHDEIDLSKKNASALRKAVADFIDHGRRVKAGTAPAGKVQRQPVPRKGPDPAAVRQWAAGEGTAVSSRGRVSAEIIAQYEAAHA